MNIVALFQDKGLKAKEKTEMLSQALLGFQVSELDLLAVASSAKDPDKATCIEALEFATRQNPGLVTGACLTFVSEALASKAPRIKWESAKVIANIAHRFPDDLELAVSHLLANTLHEGTVVRWSAATALGAILTLKLEHFASLGPTLEAICKQESQGSIQKIYRAAFKKAAATKG